MSRPSWSGIRTSSDIRTLARRRGSRSRSRNPGGEFLDLYVLKNERERLHQEEGALNHRLRRVRERIAEVDGLIRERMRQITPASSGDGADGSKGHPEASIPYRVSSGQPHMPQFRKVTLSY